MASYTATYKEGVQIITHASGVVTVDVTSNIKEHKQDIQQNIAELEVQVRELDKQIKLCEGETVLAKVIHFIRRDNIV